MEDASAVSSNGDGPTVRSPDATSQKSLSPPPSLSPGHKRSLSGNFLSRLPFLRSSFEELPSAQSKSPPSRAEQHDGPEEVTEDWQGGGALANALKQGKTRKRKGSLRKTALLGRGKLGLERRNSAKNKSQPDSVIQSGPFSPEEEFPPQTSGHEHASSASSSGNGWVETPQRPPSVNDDDRTPRAPLGSPIAIPANTHNPYASTTDEEESLSFSRVTTNSSASSSPSYFPLQNTGSSSLQRRRSNRQYASTHSSPLSRPPTYPEDEWDYSETEWWGWVVLVVTWIVFVVGMGSCLGVWGWAWDVGETPYAPPELEDDPTLPVTGYYPALIILTAVMAWVWVIIAWVGMKYFRHAKVLGEDT